MKTILEALAEFAIGISFDEIPRPVIHQANRCLLDLMGSFWGGFADKRNRKLLQWAHEVNPKSEAGLWGMGLRAGMAEAALGHGCISHHLEYDDGISLGAHWGSETIPAILAMAEANRCGGEELLTAIVVAYEVGNRVSQAFSRKLLSHGVHFPCAMGIFGAAAGVARLMGLSVSQTAGALGNACLTPIAPYLPALSGASIKDAYAGWPNALGLTVTRLSRAGWSGPLDLLEGPEGFGRVAGWKGSVKDLRKQILRGMGSTFEIMKTYFKPFPCCRWLHAPAQAVLDLKMGGGWRGEEAQSIVVEGPDFLRSYDKKNGFEREISARFSIPYVVAAAALWGRLDLEAFDASRRSHPKLRALTKRVTITTDETLDRMFPDRFQTRVRVKTRDGRRWEKVLGLPWGPDNPPTDPELKKKFSYLAGQSLKSSRVEGWFALFEEGVERDKRLKRLLGLLLPKVNPNVA
jgi:2-methylcitrate dehydratase PrpD